MARSSKIKGTFSSILTRPRWLVGSLALVLGWGIYSCGSDDAVQPSVLVPGQDGGIEDTGIPDLGIEDDGGFDPTSGSCWGHANHLVCVNNIAFNCGADEQPISEVDCDDEVCVPDTGCVLCLEGQYTCQGNNLMSCNVGPPLAWELVATCNPASGQACKATKGTCESLPITGGTTPTGWYYQYARFLLNSGFEGGYDVDSYDNLLYVNRDSQHLDVYQVEGFDTDGDGDFEPNQHPDNPDELGPIEDRVLTKVTTYTVQLGSPSQAEVYALSDRVYLLNRNLAEGNIYEYDFSTAAFSTKISAAAGLYLAQMGYDDVEERWYGSSEQARRVYSFDPITSTWVAEFRYPDLAGSHMDGLEVITDPNTGTSYVYVSDMTSDFLGQYKRDRDSGWVQVNLFQYSGTGEYVEGMGFGAFNHFWATGGGALYEIGGGDLAKYTEPWTPPR